MLVAPTNSRAALGRESLFQNDLNRSSVSFYRMTTRFKIGEPVHLLELALTGLIWSPRRNPGLLLLATSVRPKDHRIIGQFALS